MSKKQKYPVLSVETWRNILAMSPTAAKELFSESARERSIENLLHVAQAGYGTSTEGADYLKSVLITCLGNPIGEKVLPTWLNAISKETKPDEFQAILRTQLRFLGEARGAERVVEVGRILMQFGADPFYDHAAAYEQGYSHEPSGIEVAIKHGNLAMLELYLEEKMFDADHPMPTLLDVDAVDLSALDLVFPRRNLISAIADSMTSLTSLEESLALVRGRIAPAYMEPFYVAFEHGIERFIDAENKFGRRRKALRKMHEIAGGATPRPTAHENLACAADWRTVANLPANEDDVPLLYCCILNGGEPGALALARFITEGGIDLNTVDPKYGTLLHMAAWADNTAAAQTLISLGADPLLRVPFPMASDEGKSFTAVEVAEEAAHEDVARMILASTAHNAVSSVLAKLKPRTSP